MKRLENQLLKEFRQEAERLKVTRKQQRKSVQARTKMMNRELKKLARF